MPRAASNRITVHAPEGGFVVGLAATPIVLFPLWSVLPLAVSTVIVLGLEVGIAFRLRGLAIGLAASTALWTLGLWWVIAVVEAD